MASRPTANVSSPPSHPCITTHHTSQPTALSYSWTPPFAGPPSTASNSCHHDSQPSSRCGSNSTFDLATDVRQARPRVLPQPARYRRAIFTRRATRPRGRSRRVTVVRRRAGWCPGGEVQPIWMEARTSSRAARFCGDVFGRVVAPITSRVPSTSRTQIWK